MNFSELTAENKVKCVTNLFRLISNYDETLSLLSKTEKVYKSLVEDYRNEISNARYTEYAVPAKLSYCEYLQQSLERISREITDYIVLKEYLCSELKRVKKIPDLQEYSKVISAIKDVYIDGKSVNDTFDKYKFVKSTYYSRQNKVFSKIIVPDKYVDLCFLS